MTRRSVLWALLVLLLPALAPAQDWTRFRGPNGTGESELNTLPAVWTEKDYDWRIELPGRGHSSPVLWGQKLFLTTAEEEGHQRILLCIDAKSGKILWQKRFAATTHPLHAQNSFASSTPVVDAQMVYVVWATPEQYAVVALDHTGKQKWQVDLGPFLSQHGFGTSPVLFGDLLVVNNDQDGDSSLVALDRKTGERRWQTPRRTAVAAYSTPCEFRPAGGPVQLIFNSQAHGITSIDPSNGHLNWEVAVFDKRSVSSPLVVGDLVFGSCGSGGGGNYVVAVRPNAGNREATIAYKIDKSAPYVPTSVAKGKLLFLWGDGGVVSCLDAPAGKILWQKRVGGSYSGSPVRAGDKLYCLSTEGDVVVLAARDEFEQLGRQSLGEVCRSTPAVAGGRIYLRSQSHLISLGGKYLGPASASGR